MKRSIVFKWFALTALLFSAMFVLIWITQNHFFERFYIDKKSDSLEIYMDEFTALALTEGAEAASGELFRSNHIWVAKLDEYGRIRDIEDYYIEVKLRSETQPNLRIPMYSFEGYFSDFTTLFKPGDEVVIDAVDVLGEMIPYQIQTDSMGVVNLNIANILHGPHASASYTHLTTGLYKGQVTKAVLPERVEDVSFPYNERFFLKQIKEFQADLLADSAAAPRHQEEFSATENLVDYKIIVEPIVENDEVEGYIFAMTSLQPVGEAIAAMQQFYPYFFGFAFLSIVLLAFIVFKRLTKPLLSVNRITGKIAAMDFTENLPVHSDDEIGQLSLSINHLSRQMEAHIGRLNQELDQERKLETIRKEFIAGVSHELKTPLAVMKSCLSILRDGIAVEKTEHYFQAMENEVQRMDMLVVNMLDLAKFESGTYQPEMVPFAVERVITEVCASLAGQIQEKNISLALRLCPLMVVGHKGLIARVITNFLNNAIRHTNDGHAIVIAIERNEQTAEISVENQGDPISDEDSKKLWDQFYRVEARVSKTGSTGLGLSISKGILELHHADYGVENTKDGVRFFFSLPLQN